MNWQAFRHTRKTVGLTLASTALAALAFVPGTAQAQSSAVSVSSGPSVTILTPAPGQTFEGSKQIEVSAFYQDSSATGGIVDVEIMIDGQTAATKKLDKPELRGVVSFLIDPSTLDSGDHQVLVKVTSVSGDTARIRTALTYTGAPNEAPSVAGAGAAIAITSPLPSQHVSGVVTINVNTTDAAGKSPFISLFIDKEFKTLRNYAPYSFDWDTTRVVNGWHTIEISGFNDDNLIGKTDPMRVFVNNGGGDTVINHDLLDTPSAPTSAAPAPAPAADISALGSAQLAHPSLNAPAINSAIPVELATANVGDNGLSSELLLNVPFLDKKPMPMGAEVTPTTPAQIAQAIHQVVAFSPAQQQLASASIGEGEVSNDVSLSAPFVQTSPSLAPSSNVVVEDGRSSIVPLTLPKISATGGDAVALETDTQMTAPVANRLSVPMTKVAGVKRNRAVVEAKLARRPSLAPVKTSGSSRLMAAADVTTQISTDTLLKAPFINMHIEHVTATSMPVAAHHSNVPKVSVGVTKMASAQIDMGIPNDTPHAPRVSASIADGIVVDHAPIAIARPQSGIFSAAAVHNLDGEYQVVMNNEPVTLERPIQDHADVLCAPIRRLFESQGGRLEWSSATKTVHAMTATKDIQLKIGSNMATINNEHHKMSTAAYINAGHTMIPVGFLPLAMNVVVSYDGATGHLVINSKD